jgi:UrcA family protein
MTRLILTAVVCAMALGYPASAEPVSTVVSTRGLDLSTAHGRAQLDARVQRAARRMCTDPGVRGVAATMAANRCTADAVDGAAVQFAARQGETLLAPAS